MDHRWTFATSLISPAEDCGDLLGRTLGAAQEALRRPREPRRPVVVVGLGEPLFGAVARAEALAAPPVAVEAVRVAAAVPPSEDRTRRLQEALLHLRRLARPPEAAERGSDRDVVDVGFEQTLRQRAARPIRSPDPGPAGRRPSG